MKLRLLSTTGSLRGLPLRFVEDTRTHTHTHTHTHPPPPPHRAMAVVFVFTGVCKQERFGTGFLSLTPPPILPKTPPSPPCPPQLHHLLHLPLLLLLLPYLFPLFVESAFLSPRKSPQREEGDIIYTFFPERAAQPPAQSVRKG